MQHNVPAAFFHLAQYYVCSSRRRCQRACVRRVFYACRLALHIVAAHNNMRYARLHGMRSVRLPRFGDTFQ